MLNQTPSQIITDPRQYKTLIYGRPGVGKTSFGAQIDGHYFLITEAGTSGVSVYGSVITTWAEAVKTLQEIIHAKKNDFKDMRKIDTIVIDTYDNLWKMAGEYVCQTVYFAEAGKKAKVSRIEDASYGKGYKATNDLILKILNIISLNGLGCILISHVKERTIKWRGEDIPFYSLDLVPSAVNAIVNDCDAIGFFEIIQKIQKDEEGRIVSVEEGRQMIWQPHFGYLTKHRLDGFPDILELPKDKGWQIYLDAFKETVQQQQL